MWAIPSKRFGNETYIARRRSSAPEKLRADLDRCLHFLYLEKRNILRKTIRAADSALESRECLLLRYLQTRVSGSEKKRYGHGAVAEAKAAKFRCRKCGATDVRVLTLDHESGKKSRTFRLLCANCHQVKSRRKDWEGCSNHGV